MDEGKFLKKDSIAPEMSSKKAENEDKKERSAAENSQPERVLTEIEKRQKQREEFMLNLRNNMVVVGLISEEGGKFLTDEKRKGGIAEPLGQWELRNLPGIMDKNNPISQEFTPSALEIDSQTQSAYPDIEAGFINRDSASECIQEEIALRKDGGDGAKKISKLAKLFGRKAARLGMERLQETIRENQLALARSVMEKNEDSLTSAERRLRNCVIEACEEIEVKKNPRGYEKVLTGIYSHSNLAPLRNSLESALRGCMMENKNKEV